MENIKGWRIDLKAVYGWRWADREKFGLREDLWESEGRGFAALLYGICEIGVSKEIGRLAIYRCKEKPELAFHLPCLECWYQYDSSAQFGKDGLLFVHRFSSGAAGLGVRICALDLAAGRFALVDGLPERFYRVRFIGGKEYGFTLAGEAGLPETVIDVKTLSWRGLPRRWWERLVF